MLVGCRTGRVLWGLGSTNLNPNFLQCCFDSGCETVYDSTRFCASCRKSSGRYSKVVWLAMARGSSMLISLESVYCFTRYRYSVASRCCAQAWSFRSRTSPKGATGTREFRVVLYWISPGGIFGIAIIPGWSRSTLTLTPKVVRYHSTL